MVKANVRDTSGFEGGEFPELVDASEFREINGQPRSTGYPAVFDDAPVKMDTKAVIREQAIYPNGMTADAVELTTPVAARTYNSAIRYLKPSPTPTLYPGDPSLIVGDDSQRRRLILQSVDGDIIVGPLDQIQGGQGFLLTPGNLLETQVQGTIYACTQIGDTNVRQVTIWIEREG